MKEFSSLGAFAAHLVTREAEVAFNLHAGLEVVARRVEETAKSEIGMYQPEVGNFPEWAPLAESTLEEKERLGFAPPDNPLLREGHLRDSIEHETHVLDAVIGSKSDIAAYQEFGTASIPPRSFIGPAMVRNVELLERMTGAAAVIGIGGGARLNPALGYDLSTRLLPKE